MTNVENARKWWVFAAVSLLFSFCSASTFSSLGIVLYTMAGEFHWSMAEAGTSFSVLGLACCLTSPVPPLFIRRIGSGGTLALGGAVMAAGFLIAWRAHDLLAFYAAMALVGGGFTLCANITGVYVIAGWFRPTSARMIGIYLMSGAFGGVLAPPLVQMLVARGGWHLHWLVMAGIAAALALFAFVVVRDAAHSRPGASVDPSEADDEAGSDGRRWTYRLGLGTPQFLVLALSMIVTQTTVTTLNSAVVPHFLHLGTTAQFAALMLSLQALMATIAKGLSGSVANRLDPRWLLAGGLLVHAVGLALFGVATTHAVAGLFALTFGLGWGCVYLSVTVLMIRYFGRLCGTALMSTVWLLTGFAAAGPALAGVLADRFGTFVPVFDACGLLLLPIAVAAFAMRPPVQRASMDGKPVLAA